MIFGEVKHTLFKGIPSMKSLKNIENISSWEYLERHGKRWNDTRFSNANIGIEEDVYEGGLWGCDYLVDSVRKHDQACESIKGRDNVKIKSREILLKKNLPKQNQRTL